VVWSIHRMAKLVVMLHLLPTVGVEDVCVRRLRSTMLLLLPPPPLLLLLVLL